jgi:hypothetical protein
MIDAGWNTADGFVPETEQSSGSFAILPHEMCGKPIAKRNR